MTPPTTIIASPRPTCRSAFFSAGASARWPGRERGDADDMGLALRRERRDFFGRREQRADLDVEAEIGERRGDDLLAAVMAVLAHLGDQNARAAGRRSPRRRGSSR